MLRIRDNLVWFRIRGSVLLTNGSGSRLLILLFSSLTFKTPTKNYFTAYLFLKVYFHHFSKIKKQEVTKQLKSRFFLLFLLDDRRIQILYRYQGSQGCRRIRDHLMLIRIHHLKNGLRSILTYSCKNM